MFRRAAGLLAVLPLASFAALVPSNASAAAVVMPTCPSGAVYAFDTLGGNHNGLSVYTASPTETRICVQVFGVVADLTIVVHTDAEVTKPEVTQVPGTGTCTQKLFDMTVPQQIHLSIGVDQAASQVCVGTNGTTTTATFAQGSVDALPSIEVWRSGTGTTLDTVHCAVVPPPGAGCTTTPVRIL
jgi:hypothetical protein